MSRKRWGSPPPWLVVGVIVDYCAVIGEPPTQRGMRVQDGPWQMASGHWCVWLEGKSGCVAVEACKHPIDKVTP